MQKRVPPRQRRTTQGRRRKKQAIKQGHREDVKGVVDDEVWDQAVADAALACNARQRLFALCREVTSLVETTAPELADVADGLRCAVAEELAMNPRGAFFLMDAVSAAFDIGGGLAAKDPAFREKLNKLRTVPATQGKQSKAIEIGYIVRQWRAEGASVVTIQKRLAAKGTKFKRSPQAIYVYLKQDDSF
jgi:hypothetical protein